MGKTTKLAQSYIRKPRLLVVLAIIVLVGLSAFLYKANHKKTVILPGATVLKTNTSPESTSADTNSKIGAASGADAAVNPQSPNSTAALIAPSGSFVSNHHPSSSTSFAEQSLCITTPGAECYIEFTKGSTVYQLPSQKSENGTVIWNWDVNTAGLEAGTWKITAVAKMNSETKSTTDSLSLVITK